jgi:hypothetical protein
MGVWGRAYRGKFLEKRGKYPGKIFLGGKMGENLLLKLRGIFDIIAYIYKAIGGLLYMVGEILYV